jgi:hypothetical protein
VGRSAEVVAAVLAQPEHFGNLFDGMLAADPVLRMRCADAVEKITLRQPDLLRPYKKKLIAQVAQIEQPEVRWHVAQLVTRLRLTARERRTVVGVLNRYLTDKSSIVKTFAMQALADLAEQDADLRPAIVQQLKTLTRAGTPAMRARGKKLLARLTQR